MKLLQFLSVHAICVISIMIEAGATDVFFPNEVRISPNGKFKIEAISPKNSADVPGAAFADEFVYTLSEVCSGKTLWTRKQGADEGSCLSLHIDDDAWVVIITGDNELLPVAPDGRIMGNIDILTDAMTSKERKEFVSDTTAGPMWEGYSEWYFERYEHRRLFVIRPWWGRRIVVDLEKAALTKENPAMARAFSEREVTALVRDLRQAVEQRATWDQGEACGGAYPVLKASFLAGCLRANAAIPYLELLQDSNYSGSSTLGGLGYGVDFRGRVNPHNYSSYELRKVIRFALRRMGKIPKFLPCHEFRVTASEPGVKDKPYQFKAKAAPGAAEIKKAGKGMSAMEVLDLLGAPEWITYDTWEYDIDIDPPVTLRIKWDESKVVEVSTQDPAAWKRELIREAQIAR
jgi:hypothetical protein